MKQFAIGFAVASLLWGGLVFAWHSGVPMPGHDTSEAGAAVDADLTEPSPGHHRATRRSETDGARRRPTRSRPEADSEGEVGGEGSVGDAMDEAAARELDLEAAGGEAQLPASAIEAAFDTAMPSIRRCLVLVDASDPVIGTLRFQLRVGPDGSVTAAHLRGPSAATAGQAGACLHAAARALSFDSFDGPEMDVSYPLHLE